MQVSFFRALDLVFSYRSAARLLRNTQLALGILAFAALLGSPGQVSADNVEIEFDFTGGSSLSLLGGVIVTPPDGTLDVGGATVDLEATDLTTIVPGGAAALSGLNASGTVAKNFPGSADISGPYSATQVGTLPGTVSGALDGVDFVTDLQLDINVAFDCTGTGCFSLGFPVNENGTFDFAITFLPITNMGMVGGAGIDISVPIEVGGILGTLNLVGVEVGRTFIPEPGTALLVGLGLVVMGVARRRDVSREV